MKKIVFGLIAALTVSGAQASYLAWQVGANEFGTSYDNANIYATDGVSTHLLGSYWASSDPASDAAETDIATPMQAVAFADLKSYGTSSYSYYIELSNYSQSGNEFVAVSSPSVTYTDLMNEGSIIATLPSGTLANIQVWHPTTYSVPEPTSALLMLFGAAMLGLKRKNRSIA